MEHEAACERCDGEELVLVEAFAAEDSSGEIEVLVWSCAACGGRTQTAAALPGEAEEVDPARRVA